MMQWRLEHFTCPSMAIGNLAPGGQTRAIALNQQPAMLSSAPVKS
jgi:hypothetical protein